jgi:hypothetical protein
LHEECYATSRYGSILLFLRRKKTVIRLKIRDIAEAKKDQSVKTQQDVGREF